MQSLNTHTPAPASIACDAQDEAFAARIARDPAMRRDPEATARITAEPRAIS